VLPDRAVQTLGGGPPCGLGTGGGRQLQPGTGSVAAIRRGSSTVCTPGVTVPRRSNHTAVVRADTCRHETTPAGTGVGLHRSALTMPTCSKHTQTITHLTSALPIPTTADRLALARTVAADPTERALRLDQDNGADGWVSLPAGVESGCAFAVRVADRLLAVDADDPGPGYLQLLDLLCALYVPHVELASGGSDHRRHLWVVLGDLPADLRTQLVGAVRALGLDPRAGGSPIRPPLTPHRSGPVSTLLAPLTPAQAVSVLAGPGCGPDRAQLLADALPDPMHQPLPARPHAPTTPHARLPDRTRYLLDHRDLRYSTRSEQLRAVLVSLANAGWDQTAAVDLVLAHRVAERAHSKRDPRGWVAEQYQRALSWVAAHPPVGDLVDTRVELARCRSAAASWVWQRGLGSAPATLARVLGAVLDVAADAGTLRPSVSVRQLAERAGVGRSAAERALGVLCSQRVLVRVRRASGTDAATYQIDTHHQVLSLGGDRQRDTKPDTPPAVSSVPQTVTPPCDPRRWLPDHDGWRHGGLGGSALRVAQHLDPDTPLTARQIAARCGLSRSWLLVLLRRLAAAGLVERTDAGWLPAPPETRSQALERAAERYGTAGTGERQRERHAVDRASWDRLLALRLARRHAVLVPDSEDPDLVWLVERDTGVLIGSRRAPAPPPTPPPPRDQVAA